MDREIKFRLWDTKGKKLYYPECYSANDEDLTICVDGDELVLTLDGRLVRDDHYDIDGTLFPVEEDRFILMQYTGLKDKNGKDIYEGDILCWEYVISFSTKTGEHRVKSFAEVVWGKGGFTLNKIVADISRGVVICNIYEHKELLENG